MKPISIAIDGPSGAGKSTIARKTAEKFGFIYVDTGAIYRTVGLAAYRRGIASKDSAAVIAMLPELHIELRHGADGLQRMYLDGEDVSDAIRMPEISIYASDVSAVPEVRAFLMEMQRSFARTQNVIMDGRDIGTVVLPDAGLKIFLTASVEARANAASWSWRRKGRASPLKKYCAIWNTATKTIPPALRRLSARRRMRCVWIRRSSILTRAARRWNP